LESNARWDVPFAPPPPPPEYWTTPQKEATPNDIAICRASEMIKEADMIWIGTGAGMGVASGLGTFRGVNAGVWPPLKKLGLDFTDLSDPVWFEKDAALGWSFWFFRFLDISPFFLSFYLSHLFFFFFFKL